MSLASPTNGDDDALDDLREGLAEWRLDYLRAVQAGVNPGISPVLLLAGGRLLVDAAQIGAVIDLRRPWPEEEEGAQ